MDARRQPVSTMTVWCVVQNLSTWILSRDASLDRSEAEKREVEVRLAPFSMSAPVVLLVRSNAPEIVREALSMGFTREKEPPTGFFFLGWSKTTQEKNLVWCRRTTFSDLEGVISEIGSHGSEVKNFILEDDRN